MALIPQDTPPLLREFLYYMLTIRGKSSATVTEYYLDLRTFYRFLKLHRKLVPQNLVFDNIPIDDVDLDLLRGVTLSDLYEFIAFASSERPIHHRSQDTEYGNAAAALARKVASLRSFFKYLVNKKQVLLNNPAAELESPKQSRKLPKYLSVEESLRLLSAVDGDYKERDYCILTLFLNCGLRVSELAGVNLTDIEGDMLRVTGKGNKERVIYLNDACQAALAAYLPHRLTPKPNARNALFISRLQNRISVQTVKYLVNKYLGAAGLSDKGYSAHKLRHTAATLMYQNGVDIRTVQEFLGHEQVNTTMIYTHFKDDSLRQAGRANPLSTARPAESRDEDASDDGEEPV